METNSKLQTLNAAASSENKMQCAPEKCIQDGQAVSEEAIEIVYRGRIAMAFPLAEEAPAEEMEALTKAERADFRKCEKAFEKGVAGIAEGYKSLDEIRARRLYRETNKTFNSYCLERWGFTAKHAYRTIAAGKTIEELSPFGDITCLTTEAHVRPLTALPSTDEKLEAVRGAEQKADGKKVTSKDVAESVKEVKARVKHKAASDEVAGAEEVDAPEATSPPAKKASVPAVEREVIPVRDILAWVESLREKLENEDAEEDVLEVLERIELALTAMLSTSKTK